MKMKSFRSISFLRKLLKPTTSAGKVDRAGDFGDECSVEEICEEIKSSGLFSESFYLKENEDVKISGADPVYHYVIWGEKEGRWPNPLFDPQEYLELHRDIKDAGISPLLHYYRYGIYEKRDVTRASVTSDRTVEKACNVSRLIEVYNSPIPRLSLLEQCVDIIVPVYNNLNLVRSLLNSVKSNTMSKHRIIIIDDASPEPGVEEYLRDFSRNSDNVNFIRNEVNLGFVGTCNKAFKLVESNVVILNTDAEVPPGWMERLISPIEQNPSVATTTPFSNCATICSFPEMPGDNEMYLDLDVTSIDHAFSQLVNCNQPVPTGVGFCMGISKKALDEIGGFDREKFGRGYGEENDWCMRATSRGYKNIHVTNLFVSHEHGGSFAEDEKKKLVSNNFSVLIEMWPDYGNMVSDVIRADKTLYYRKMARILLMCRRETKPEVIIDHDYGGGTTDYRERRIQGLLGNKQSVLLVVHDKKDNSYRIVVRYLDEMEELYASNFMDVYRFLMLFQIERIVLNSIVGYGYVDSKLALIKSLREARHCKLDVMMHDYYPICPSYTLIDSKGIYCAIPNQKECHRCFKKHKEISKVTDSVVSWRAGWGLLFTECDNIVMYSNSSRDIFAKAYPEYAAKAVVTPHSMEYFKQCKVKLVKSRAINVGVVGAINKQKGLEVIRSLAKALIKRSGGDIVTIIGITSDSKLPDNVHITGRYQVSELPPIIEQTGVNVFLMPSVWPETFSYVTEEIMALGLPLVAFNIGAQGEKVAKYPFGAVVDIGIKPEELIEVLQSVQATWMDNRQPVSA